MRAISEVFKDIFENYQKDYDGPFDSSKTSYSLFKELDEHIKTMVTKDDDHLETHWSVGKGNWTQVPWFAVRDKRTKTSAQKGIGIVGLFKKDMSGLYLCIAQGTTQPLKDYGKKGGEEYLLEQAQRVRDVVKYLQDKKFKLDNDIDLKATGGVALTYKPSVCVHKYMSNGYDFNVKFIEDLFELVKAYKDVVAKNIDFTIDNNLKTKGAAVLDEAYLVSSEEEMDATYASSEIGVTNYSAGIYLVRDRLNANPAYKDNPLTLPEVFNRQRMANNLKSGRNAPLIMTNATQDSLASLPTNVSKLFEDNKPPMMKLRGQKIIESQKVY